MMNQTIDKQQHQLDFLRQTKDRSDRLMNFFLATYFLFGLFLSTYYDTWLVGFGVGGLSLLAYYSAKWALPKSNLYQYVMGVVAGIFMAQFIYQMHGMFEMHFFAFIGSAVLITYQNWKLQIPLALVVVVHHATFGYMQYIGFDNVYFTQLDYMTLETFIYHGFLATTVFALSGLWAYNFRKSSESQIDQSFAIGKLEEADKQKAVIIAEREIADAAIKKSQAELERTLQELEKRVEERTAEISITNHSLRSEIQERIELAKQLEAKNKDITDSILYAERLQRATFPDLKEAQKLFNRIFVLSKQKNIVGGDFYWFHHTDTTTMIACADCTGHGVPGAFMTILGTGFLNRMVAEGHGTSPTKALQAIDAELCHILGGDKTSRMDDGMDVSFCIIDRAANQIHYAGAISPIVLVSGGETKVFKGSRFGLGAYMPLDEKHFETVVIDYRKGDMLYMFTDGYADQFGGPEIKKFMQSRLVKLLGEIHELPASEQEAILKQKLKDWKGQIEQTDDIMILGLEL